MSSQRAVSAARGGGGGVGKVIRSPSCWSWLELAGGGGARSAGDGYLPAAATLHCLTMLMEILSSANFYNKLVLNEKCEMF